MTTMLAGRTQNEERKRRLRKLAVDADHQMLSAAIEENQRITKDAATKRLADYLAPLNAKRDQITNDLRELNHDLDQVASVLQELSAVRAQVEQLNSESNVVTGTVTTDTVTTGTSAATAKPMPTLAEVDLEINVHLDKARDLQSDINKEEKKLAHVVAEIDRATETNIVPDTPQNRPAPTDLVQRVNQMYKYLKNYIKANPEFKTWNDKKKLEHFRSIEDYSKLISELPIVTKYMICLGQYSSRALERVVAKTERLTHSPPENRPKGYEQDQWLCRQADYAQYLWEENRKGKHIDSVERKMVWERTYNLLKKEFDDFKDKYSEVEKMVKEDKKRQDGSRVREMLERIVSKQQELSDRGMSTLRPNIDMLLYKNIYENVLRELLFEYPPLEASHFSVGRGSDVDDKSKIKMIETVDADRMDEIADKYKDADYQADAATAAHLYSVRDEPIDYVEEIIEE